MAPSTPAASGRGSCPRLAKYPSHSGVCARTQSVMIVIAPASLLAVRSKLRSPHARGSIAGHGIQFYRSGEVAAQPGYEPADLGDVAAPGLRPLIHACRPVLARRAREPRDQVDVQVRDGVADDRRVHV